MIRLYELVKNSRVKITKSPVWIFIILASFFGVLTIAVTPPFTGADEEAHFTRAWGLTEGNIIISRGEQISMPASYRQTLGCLQSKHLVAGDVYSYKYNNYGKDKHATNDCLGDIKQSSQREAVPTTAAGYSPATYIPQVITIALGRMSGASIVTIDYMVRFSVLVAYIALGASAIYILPNRKWALVGIALLPHSLVQITNPGGDYMLYGSVALFVAAILRSKQLTDAQKTKGYSKKLFIVAAIAITFAVVPKGVFPGVCFLPLLIFFGDFRKHIAIKIGVMVFVGLIGMAWQKLMFMTTMDLPNGAQSSLGFPVAFMKTMLYQWADRDFLYYRLGFGLDNNIGMPAIVITVMNILFGVYLFVDYTKDKLKFTMTHVERRFMIGAGVVIALGVIVGSFAAMQIAGAYMQQGDNIILGVQARYFYPAFFLLAIIPLFRPFTTSQLTYSRIVIFGSILLQISQILTLAVRFDWL